MDLTKYDSPTIDAKPQQPLSYIFLGSTYEILLIDKSPNFKVGETKT